MDAAQIEQAQAMQRRGLPLRAIAEEIGVSHTSIHRVLQGAEPVLQGAEPVLQGAEPALQGAALQGAEPVLQGAEPVLQAPALQGAEPVLQGAEPALQAPALSNVDTITALLAATIEQLAAYHQQRQDLSTARAALLQADELDEQALADVDTQSTVLAGRVQHAEQRIPLLEERLEDAEATHAAVRLAELPAEAERLCEAKRVVLLGLTAPEQAILGVHREVAKLHVEHAELRAEEVYWVDRYRLPRTRLADLGDQPSLAALGHEITGIWGSPLTSMWTRRRQALNNAPRKFYARKAVSQPIPAPTVSPGPVVPPSAAGELFIEGQGQAVWDARGVTYSAGDLRDGKLSTKDAVRVFSWQQIVQLAQEKHLPAWAEKVPAVTARVASAFAAMRANGENPHVLIRIRDEQVTRTDMVSGTGVSLSLEQLRLRLDRAGTLPSAWDFPAVRAALSL